MYKRTNVAAADAGRERPRVPRDQQLRRRNFYKNGARMSARQYLIRFCKQNAPPGTNARAYTCNEFTSDARTRLPLLFIRQRGCPAPDPPPAPVRFRPRKRSWIQWFSIIKGGRDGGGGNADREEGRQEGWGGREGNTKRKDTRSRIDDDLHRRGVLRRRTRASSQRRKINVFARFNDLFDIRARVRARAKSSSLLALVRGLLRNQQARQSSLKSLVRQLRVPWIEAGVIDTSREFEKLPATLPEFISRAPTIRDNVESTTVRARANVVAFV